MSNPTIMTSITRSIDNLIRLYTIVISIAITHGLSKIFDTHGSVELKWIPLTHFVALLMTIVPFYHGASRYLDVVYVFKEREVTKDAALMIDFVILFSEGLLFFALAVLLENTVWFYGALAVILIIDTLWVAWTGFISTGGGWPNYGRWAILNVIAFILILVSLFGNFWSTSSEYIQPLALLGIAILRTVFDYIFTWSFYFPPVTAEEQT